MSATVGARATSVHREPSASTHEATTSVCVITVTTAELVRDDTAILHLGLIYTGTETETIFKGPFTLSISTNAAISLVISLNNIIKLLRFFIIPSESLQK